MKDLLLKHKVVVCVGSGGVGKTTVAAGMATYAARQGLKVLVLTVDPSRRLATALGLDPTTKTVVPVDTPDFSGQLFASLIHSKEIFDQFVIDCSPDEESAQRMMNNKLYQQLSTTLSGSQEFTALDLLYRSYRDHEYDLIVLDTPPTQHAIDFFEAPQKIYNLFQASVVKWFSKGENEGSFLKNLFTSGTTQVLGLLKRLTGSDFMDQLQDFFMNVDHLQEEIRNRTISVHRLLSSNETAFVLVTSFDEAKLKEATQFKEHIVRNGYNLSSIIINRAYPQWYQSPPSDFQSKAVQSLYEEFQAYYGEKMKKYDSFSHNLNRVEIFKIPELSRDMSDLLKIEKLIAEIEENRESGE